MKTGTDEHGHSEEPTFFSNESTEVQLVFELGTDEAPRESYQSVGEEVAVLGEKPWNLSTQQRQPLDFAGFNAGGFDIDVGARWDIERDGTIRVMKRSMRAIRGRRGSR